MPVSRDGTTRGDAMIDFLRNTLALWRLRHDPRVWPALMLTALMTTTTVAVVVSLLRVCDFSRLWRWL